METNNFNQLAAIDQTQPHPKLSERYRFVSTRSVISALESQGFVVNRAKGGRTGSFGTHTVSFRHPDLKEFNIGKSLIIPEVILRNSHNGEAALGLIAGAFRVACFNGLILGHGFGVRLVHTGNIQRDVTNTIPQLYSTIKAGMQRMQDWSQVEFTGSMYTNMAWRAVRLRLPMETISAIQHRTEFIERVMLPMRLEDEDKDLFTVYNRLQSSLITSRIQYTVNNEVKTMGKLYGAQAVLNVNQKLSTLVDTYYQKYGQRG